MTYVGKLNSKLEEFIYWFNYVGTYDNIVNVNSQLVVVSAIHLN